MDSIKWIQEQGGAVLCWQVDPMWREAVERAVADGRILYCPLTDLYYVPGYDIEAERANVTEAA